MPSSEWQSRFSLTSVLNRLRNVLQLTGHKHYSDLVSESQISTLRQLAAQATPTQLDLNLEVHHRMLGEQLSPFAKSGFEYAETRLYQYGDNIRFINWRRYANSGQLFINTFHEERRPQCWILLDRRASMRFGTRVRLKVAQAATLALYHLFKAQAQQFDIGGIILDEDNHWYEAKSSNTGFQPLIEHICSPCPPLEDKANDQFTKSLRLLKARLAPGCLIIILSDFIDLTASDLSTLNGLSNQHSVYALHMVDPIEKTLPNQGHFQIFNTLDDSITDLNCSQPGTKNQFQDRLRSRLDQIKQQLKQSQVLYQQVDSSSELLTKNLNDLQDE